MTAKELSSRKGYGGAGIVEIRDEECAMRCEYCAEGQSEARFRVVLRVVVLSLTKAQLLKGVRRR